MAAGKKTGGRVKGTPNKADRDARLAIAEFVDKNCYRLEAWLDAVALGDPVVEGDPDGKVHVAPNPEKAFQLFQSVIEYHVPKLARAELVGDPKKPLQVHINYPSGD